MTSFQILKALLSAIGDGERIGDVVVLKSALSTQRAYPRIEAMLGDVRGYHPHLDMAALAALPVGSFGHEYHRFMSSNGLHPITITGNLPESLVAENAFMVRYGIIHDMVHVLTGFDATWPGEAGVWAFVGAQGYSRTMVFAGYMSLLVAPIVSPLSIGRAWRCWRRGRAMGRAARLLLTMRLEDLLESDLSEVRSALGIAGASDGYLHADARQRLAG